jgi:hypothetical protein
MRFTLEVGDKEKSKIEFSRNCFTGSMRAFVDGRQVARQSPFSIFTHFSFRLRRRYEFMVGSAEKHKVVLEKQRPLLFAGFRSQMYRVFVDDKLVHVQQGF